MKILYHANCNDGAGAAAVALHYFKHDLAIDTCYIPVQYGQLPPETDPGELVYILDFSYPRETLADWAKTNPIILIDHNKTAAADLATPIPGVKTIFSMEHSAAVLTWMHFYPDQPVPQLLLHIEDRDLWRFNLPDTRYIHYALQIHHWEYWLDPEKTDLDELIQQGKAISYYLDARIIDITAHFPVQFFTGHTVPVYNLPGFLISDCLATALARWPEAPFAVGYTVHADKITYSLRSRPGSDVDVSAIAQAHGGGGHKHAAGFAVDLPTGPFLAANLAEVKF